MQKFDAARLNGPIDWSGPTLEGFGETAIKLRWISNSYRWHQNDGAELFLVLDGEVEMHVRRPGEAVTVDRLSRGQMVLIEEGEEHVAHPLGEARVLVVERA